MGIWVNSFVQVVSRFWEMNSLDFKVGPKPDKRGENDINLDTDYHVSSS